MIDLSALNPILKDRYAPWILEQVHTETMLLDKFTEGDALSFDGRAWIVPNHVGRDHASIGFVGEGRQMPTPTAPKHVEMRITARKSAGRFQFSREALDAAGSSEGAFASAFSVTFDHLIEDLSDMRNKAMSFYGSDILARVNGNPASSAVTITVDDPGGVALPTGVNNGTRFLQAGQLIAAIRAGAIVSNTPLRVAAIAPSANYNNITVDANSADLADNDVLVRAHASTITDPADTSYQQAPMGILGHVDDGTYVGNYHGVNRVSWPVMQSYVFSSVGGLSTDILQQAIDVAYTRGRGKIDTWICEQAVRRQILALSEGIIRYQGSGNVNPDAGSMAGHTGRTITWSEIPVEVDYNFPYGILVGADSSTFKRFTNQAGMFDDFGGSLLVPNVELQTYMGIYYVSDNFLCTAPNKCVRLDGIDVTVTVVHVE